MPRYIDADKLCELARNHIDRTVDCNDIMRFPLADVQEVKHGKWERTNPATPKSYRRTCSLCKMVAYMIGDEYPYCPNCGAEMGGDERC